MQMKAKFTALAGALALAGFTGGAHAAIATGSDGNGELYLAVWDSIGQTSYTRDLGVRMNDFLEDEALGSTGLVTALGYTQTWANDSVWASWTSGMTDAQKANLVWDVTASDNAGTTAAHQLRYLSTSVNDVEGNNTFKPANSQLSNFGNVGANYTPAVNNLTPAPENQNFAANVSSIATAADGFAYFNTGNRGSDWGTAAAPFTTTGAIGSAMNFFYITRSSTNGLAKSLVLAYDNAYGRATFNLGANGDLVYLAPVPEAETWALLGLGLIGVGALARRRGRALQAA
jgi:hypothetical protein